MTCGDWIAEGRESAARPRGSTGRWKDTPHQRRDPMVQRRDLAGDLRGSEDVQPDGSKSLSRRFTRAVATGHHPGPRSSRPTVARRPRALALRPRNQCIGDPRKGARGRSSPVYALAPDPSREDGVIVALGPRGVAFVRAGQETLIAWFAENAADALDWTREDLRPLQSRQRRRLLGGRPNAPICSLATAGSTS